MMLRKMRSRGGGYDVEKEDVEEEREDDDVKDDYLEEED